MDIIDIKSLIPDIDAKHTVAEWRVIAAGALRTYGERAADPTEVTQAALLRCFIDPVCYNAVSSEDRLANYFRCNVCGHTTKATGRQSRYCPWCGARIVEKQRWSKIGARY